MPRRKGAGARKIEAAAFLCGLGERCVLARNRFGLSRIISQVPRRMERGASRITTALTAM
jgi:hypothetical protein